jgi:hypothetical protein
VSLENFQEDATRCCRIGIGLALLVGIQVLSILPIIPQDTSAQASNEVMVPIGEKSREACEMQDRRSDDDSWGGQTIEGLWAPCDGGLVTAYRTTQELSQNVERGLSSTGGEEVRIVPLTGDAEEDAEAVHAEIAAIHEMFDPEANALDFMAPGTLEGLYLADSAPSTSVLAAECHNGQKVGTWRRKDIHMKAPGPKTVIHGYVKYKRISCKLWKIKELRLWMNNPPSKRVWFHELRCLTRREALGASRSGHVTMRGRIATKRSQAPASSQCREWR